jgi:hypothetical protein
MGSGRLLAAGIALAVSALASAGCGAESHPNEHRAQPPTRVSVAITPSSITVRPARIAFGPEASQQIPQNQHAGQPPVRSKKPVDVVFVTANLTDIDSQLAIEGPTSIKSGPLVANGNASLLTALPTGSYRLHAVGLPRARPVSFRVGPYRSSSQNDVLLP